MRRLLSVNLIAERSRPLEEVLSIEQEKLA